MKDSAKLWEIWQLSQKYNKQPSDLLGIDHPLRRFYFDRAVAVFGTRVDAAIDEATRDKKNAKAAEAAAAIAISRWVVTTDIKKAFRAPTATM